MAVDSFNKYLIVSAAGEVLKNEWRTNLGNGVVFIVISGHLAITDVVILHCVSQSIWTVPIDNCEFNINVGDMNSCGGTW